MKLKGQVEGTITMHFRKENLKKKKEIENIGNKMAVNLIYSDSCMRKLNVHTTNQ